MVPAIKVLSMSLESVIKCFHCNTVVRISGLILWLFQYLLFELLIAPIQLTAVFQLKQFHGKDLVSTQPSLKFRAMAVLRQKLIGINWALAEVFLTSVSDLSLLPCGNSNEFFRIFYFTFTFNLKLICDLISFKCSASSFTCSFRYASV